MCEILEFSDFAQKGGKKSDSSLKIFRSKIHSRRGLFSREWKILVQKYPLGETFFFKKGTF